MKYWLVRVPSDPLVHELDVGGQVVPDGEGLGAQLASKVPPVAVAAHVLGKD